MTHTGHRADTNLAIVEDGIDLRIDDQAHVFIVVCGPEQSEGPVLLELRDGSPAEAEADQPIGELWRDVRDARRAVRG